MGKGLIAALGLLGVLIVTGIIFLVMYVSYNNSEARLRNQIVAVQRDNTSQLDNVTKTISQNAQVTQEQREALKEIIVGNAEARSTKGGSLATMVQEAVPNLSTTSDTYRQLMNIITGARNQWTQRQTALLDYKREHDNLIDTQPSRFFVVTLGGKEKIDVTIVTSTRTEDAFKSGKDDDDTVFRKPTPATIEK